MNMPLFRAAALISSISPKTVSYPAGELMTICTGRPPVEPGSGGSEKANTCSPVISLSLPWTSGLSSMAVRSRSSQGLRIIPAMPLRATLHAVDDEARVGLRERGERLVQLFPVGVDIVQIGVSGALTREKTIPWSSSGASSDLVCRNRKAVMPRTTTANSAVTGRKSSERSSRRPYQSVTCVKVRSIRSANAPASRALEDQ